MTINDELMKINNIHSSLNSTCIMTYIILRETHKSKFNEAQIQWINDRIDLLEEKNRQTTEDGLAHVDLELAKMPLLSKCTDYGELKELV